MRFVLLEEPFSPAKISCVPEVLTMNTNTIQHYLSADGIRLTVADTSAPGVCEDPREGDDRGGDPHQ